MYGTVRTRKILSVGDSGLYVIVISGPGSAHAALGMLPKAQCTTNREVVAAGNAGD